MSCDTRSKVVVVISRLSSIQLILRYRRAEQNLFAETKVRKTKFNLQVWLSGAETKVRKTKKFDLQVWLSWESPWLAPNPQHCKTNKQANI